MAALAARHGLSRARSLCGGRPCASQVVPAEDDSRERLVLEGVTAAPQGVWASLLLCLLAKQSKHGLWRQMTEVLACHAVPHIAVSRRWFVCMCHLSVGLLVSEYYSDW